MEGSLELCRLEALWHGAKAPHLTRWPRGGWNDVEPRLRGMQSQDAVRRSSRNDPSKKREIKKRKKKKEHGQTWREKASLPSS